MKTLDWYILKKYLSTFFFIIFIFSLIAVVVDFSEKLDDIIEYNAPLSEVLFDYYLNFIPYINGLLFPLYALIAVIFFTSRMANNSEIISIIGNGVNYYRMLRPYFIGATIIACLHLALNHFIVPDGGKRRVAFENKYIWHHNFEGNNENIRMFLNPTEEVYIRYFHKKDSSGRDFSIVKYKGQEIESKLTASIIELVEPPNHWKIRNYRIRTFDGLDEEIIKGSSIDTILPFTADDFLRRDNLKETMNTIEIDRFISQERARGTSNPVLFEVERHKRSAEPFTIFILTIIGVSVASRKVRGGMGMHLVVGAVLGSLYIFMTKFSTTFSTKGGLSPMLGVWMPNIIFTFVALILLQRAQK